jgi:hypothetical protein
MSLKGRIRRGRDKLTDYTADAGGDEVDEGVRGCAVFDEDGGALDNCVDGLQAGGAHCLAGF